MKRRLSILAVFLLMLAAFVGQAVGMKAVWWVDCCGGFDQQSEWWYLLDHEGFPLEDGAWTYAAWVGPDKEIDPPNAMGYPAGDDVLLFQSGDYVQFGTFYITATVFDPEYPYHPQKDELIYCRLFDDPMTSVGPGNYYADSQLYAVPRRVAENFYCLFPGDPGGGYTNTPVYTGAYKSALVYGGRDSSGTAIWPLTDVDGRRLPDGDLIQLIWTGPDDLLDPIDELMGVPSGDDRLLAAWGIGHGESEEGTGLFTHPMFTCQGHHPATGDRLYLRVFNGPDCRQATHYGESDLYTVRYDDGETFLSFADAANDAVIPNPAYTSVEEWSDSGKELPGTYLLSQNYPNPFNASTEIRYALPAAGHVSLQVYNIRGERVATLADGHREAGTYTVRWDPEQLASGLYFCRLQVGAFAETVKMVLLR